MLLKRRFIFLFILMFLLTNSISYAATYSKPSISGSSGILIETKSGRILYSNNPHRRLPMASTTKIMTALLAIEQGNLDEKVKIKSNSVGIEGSSIYLMPEEEIILRDLVYGLMLRSGNDAAVAIANHVSGSVENFSQLMNQRAKEIGAKNTNFTNPHGLSDDNHYSTAYDLAIITREAMKYEEFKKISKTKLWTSDREINRFFYNKNKTLWQYEGGDGVKIGYTKKAGRCLVSSATRNNMQLIAVVLNDYAWFDDCYKLFDYGFNNYRAMVVYDREQYVRSIYVPNGKKDILPIVTQSSLILPLTEEECESIKTVIEIPKKINAPISKGEKIGNIRIYKDGQLLYSDNLVAREDIEEKSFIGKAFDFIKKRLNF